MSSYVISDVHGLKERYDAMLEGIHFQDRNTLYILGDIVDRGPDGILILKDIMKHKNMHMILGNHEYMMMQYYQVLHKEITDEYEAMTILERWKRNHCTPTIQQFEECDKEEQTAILSYIEQLPVAYADVVVNGRCYYLVHGYPQTAFTSGIITREEAIEKGYEVERFVWDRVDENTVHFSDHCIILGHTPTLYMQHKEPYELWSNTGQLSTASIINIDCGCAANNQHTRLGVFCLDTKEAFYF